MLLIIVILAALLAFVPLSVGLRFRQEAIQAILVIQVGLPLIKVKRQVDVTSAVEDSMEKFLSRWRSTGEPIAIPTQKTIRRFPGTQLKQAAERPMRYLARRTRCSPLRIAADIGGGDAMQTAMLSGLFWSGLGTALGVVRATTALRFDRPQVTVQPHFSEPTWALKVDCMLRTRLGHIIVAGIWLLVRAMRMKYLMAWVRESRARTRKGVVGSGRASDSRPDENGHGEP